MTFLIIAILVIAVAVVAWARHPVPRPSNRGSRSEHEELEEIIVLDLLSDGKLDGRIEPP